ncbi:hypothetical protein SARC_10972 [Sphaeroforma arctica JP610]|uniref:Isochorismatase-like domain-containing protein n=1 Tax=Sphaeroforma arctica JP610 TaxID=667725 RepID=A0A0L0FIB8_9EUKA|nr:hypothetical protein SARC_10972 [Sphaeroforma arctica JP610]KNC76527.1 hypothetical protein SARC_10972 [Sphaeroforma arctica JP610]|eukprot:XP_014150429.1 hypothetical protein SARC_10972 [Sphaeroforma arctica JP610]
MDYVLRNMGVKHLIVVGMLTNQCVEGTIRDAANKGYLCTLVTDATSAHTLEEQSSGEFNLKGFARLLTTEELITEIYAQ